MRTALSVTYERVWRSSDRSADESDLEMGYAVSPSSCKAGSDNKGDRHRFELTNSSASAAVATHEPPPEDGDSQHTPDSEGTDLHSDYALQLEITDTGRGIEPSRLERLAYTLRENYSSMELSRLHHLGLGLLTSKRIIELHGGRMWIKSAGISKGCSVTIQLPLFMNSIDKSVLSAPSSIQSRNSNGASGRLIRSNRIHATNADLDHATQTNRVLHSTQDNNSGVALDEASSGNQTNARYQTPDDTNHPNGQPNMWQATVARRSSSSYLSSSKGDVSKPAFSSLSSAPEFDATRDGFDAAAAGRIRASGQGSFRVTLGRQKSDAEPVALVAALNKSASEEK